MAKSILIVDDEPMARTLLRLMLVRSGYEVIEAVDGYDALEKLRTILPDLVVLDVMMPGLNGYDVCATIRDEKATSRIPVIMLSAKTDTVSINQGMEAGATLYLTKPVSPDELTRNVSEVLAEVSNPFQNPLG
ncbi:MAG: response regulator [Chloroflexota bacterium]